ncbi:uncharacterized protein BO87DRAFT_399718 [Aspergillus neoniger CBS 115656]|uniref:Uncharacterized protein n=1 Tax=Aspergillus neoniger (strain CBS 115656) TaxID=1448310 RepID=A0A318YB62_ASPNB|nr:hypothetical protein BO87DRAFT_399718 [Aspergillus neoniger CBS 115656]PYH31289.1 hypothetical protein BO87DRAFT_399718 [Aspergillus neoniger CBS 115656]
MRQKGRHVGPSAVLIRRCKGKWQKTSKLQYPNCLHCDRLSRISSDGSIAPPPPVPSNESATRREIGSLLCTRPIALQRASLRAAYIPPFGFPPPLLRTWGANRRHPVSPARGATVSVGLDPWYPLPHPPVERLPAVDCCRCW